MYQVKNEIRIDGQLLAILTNIKEFGQGVNFFTDQSLGLQVGVLKHKKGTSIKPHFHKPKSRVITQTNEVLIVLSGKIQANFYINKKLVSQNICSSGDILLLISGGHGFEILEKACIIEAKLGPYINEEDKVRF